jgi:endo-1,4-beta-xylanase
LSPREPLGQLTPLSPLLQLRRHRQLTNLQPTALNEDGTYRDNVFLRVIGEAYLPIAFRIAAAADPAAKLYYNDYNLEYGPTAPKTLGAVRIVKLIQSWGVKIDGVGFQGHLVTEKTGTQDVPTPSQEILEGSLRAMTDLGVDVAYTEVDIRMNTPATPQKLQDEADCYARVAASCLAVPRCVGMTIWVSHISLRLFVPLPLHPSAVIHLLGRWKS